MGGEGDTDTNRPFNAVLFMRTDDSEESPRLRTADLARLAAERLEKLRAEGEELRPVQGKSRKLASHFWGSAWMRRLALCESGGLCLAPGRSLLRHGCVLDLRVGPGRLEALVSAQELYRVHLRVFPLEGEPLEALRVACCGHIESCVSLLEGQMDAPLLERLCDPDTGLLPGPEDWRMQCSCPDWAEPCPHEAAAIYAAGILIDEDPSLLFTLRSIRPEDLLETSALAGGSPDSAARATDELEALSATFGIKLEV